MLPILFQDDHLIVVNKPPGQVVHASRLAANASAPTMKLLRDQIDAWVYPAHRLDSKTSGVLVFGLNKEVQAKLNNAFQESEVYKKYVAIVRGHTEDAGVIDYALKNLNGKVQEAKTEYKTIGKTEIPLALGKHNSSRYALVELYPSTGRYHQLRKHMAHIFHPIIGDRPHGCNKQNRLFKEEFAMIEMMLHAEELGFNHPITNEKILIKSECSAEFARMKKALLL